MKLWALILLLLVGCAPLKSQPVISSPPDAIVWNRNIARAAYTWRSEVDRRFPGAVMLIAHGSNNYLGEWYLWPDPPLRPMPVEQAARIIKGIYGNRPLVLVVCNPGHEHLPVGGVFYSKESVWTVPDSAYVLPLWRWADPTVGSVFQFVEGKE